MCVAYMPLLLNGVKQSVPNTTHITITLFVNNCSSPVHIFTYIYKLSGLKYNSEPPQSNYYEWCGREMSLCENSTHAPEAIMITLIIAIVSE